LFTTTTTRRRCNQLT